MIDDMRYLLVFAKIVQTGSITAAAQALNLSVTTTSAHLNKLEHQLGLALLYRTTRKLSLTADGMHVYATAKAMLDLYETKIQSFKQKQNRPEQHLRLALPSVFINHTPFTSLISEFMRQQPQLKLSIVYSDERADLLDENIDVALRIGRLPDSSFKARAIFQLQRVLVAHPHIKQLTAIEHPSQLAEFAWIGLSMLANQRCFIHQQTGERVCLNYHCQISVDNVEAAYRLSQQGLGVYAPPAFMCRDDLHSAKMLHVLPQWQLEPITVHALWPNNLPTNSIAYQFVQHLSRLQDAC